MVLSVVPRRHRSVVKNRRLVLPFFAPFSAFSIFPNELLYLMQLLCFFSASWHWFFSHGYRVVHWNEKSGILLLQSSIRRPRQPALRHRARLLDCRVLLATLWQRTCALATGARACQFLKENIRWKALDEIYNIYMLLHRSDFNISEKIVKLFRISRQILQNLLINFFE